MTQIAAEMIILLIRSLKIFVSTFSKYENIPVTMVKIMQKMAKVITNFPEVGSPS